MADRTLRTVLVGEDRSLGKTLTGAAGKGEHAGQRLSHAFSKLGSVLGGEVAEVVSKVSEGLDEMGNKGHRIQALGGALAGVGAVLTGIGDKERAASQQLDQAIANTGNIAEDFAGQIEETISEMERFGYTAVQTKPALQTLVQATHDPTRAIELMGEVSDLAAARHIGLGSAAEAVARIIAGRGARTMAQFNVALVANADGTTNWEKTNEALAEQLSGQANASVSGFTGTLRHLKAEVEDQVALFGEKYGPTLTAVGVGLLAFGPAIGKAASKLGSLGKAAKASAVEQSVANQAIVASESELVAAQAAASSQQLELFAATAVGAETEAAAVVAANESIAASSKAAASSGLLAKAGPLVGLAVGATAVAFAGKAIANLVDKSNAWSRSLVATEKAIKGVDESAKSLETDLVNEPRRIDEVTAAWAKQQVEGSGLADVAAKVGITMKDLTSATTGTDEEFLSLVERWKATGKLSAENLQLLVRLRDTYRETTEHVAGLSESMNRNTDELLAERRAASSASDSLDALGKSFDRLNSKTLDAKSARLAFLDAEASLSDAVKQNGTSLDQNTRKGRANIETILSAVQAAQADAKATLQRTGSAEKARAAFERDRAELRHHLIALGLDKDAVDRLLKSMAKTPAIKKTRFDIEDDQARSKLQYLEDRLDALARGRNIPVNVTLHSGRGVLQGNFGLNAEGTGSAAPGWSWVGERLPNGAWSPSAELVNFRGGEQVLSARDSARVTRGYADGTTNLTRSTGPQRIRGKLSLDPSGLYAIIDGIVEDRAGHAASMAGMDY